MHLEQVAFVMSCQVNCSISFLMPVDILSRKRSNKEKERIQKRISDMDKLRVKDSEVTT